MMDELELLKKDWQKQEQGLPKLSYDQIYNMIWKKSSSVVKWIFYVSIVEFLFWITISFIPLGSKGIDLPEANFIVIINSGVDHCPICDHHLFYVPILSELQKNIGYRFR